MYNNYNNSSYGGQGKEQRHGQNYSSSELFSSAKVLSEAAQSVYNHEPSKVNKARVVSAASDILGATGVVDESKGFGMYVDKAADYLNKHDSSSGVATRGRSGHSGGGFGGSSGYRNKGGINDRYGGGYVNNNESGYGSGRSGGGYENNNNNVIGYGGGSFGGGYGVDDRSKSGYGRYDGGYGDGRRLTDGYGESGRYGYGGRKSSEYRDENRSSGSYGGRSGGGYGGYERSGSGYYGNEVEELYGGGYGRDSRQSRPNYGYNYNN